MKRYLLLVFSFSLLQFFTEFLLISDDLVFDSLISQLSYERISELVAMSKKWKWISYIFLPILLFIKIIFATICLSIGALMLNIENGFKKFISLTITAEFIFLIPGVIKLLFFYLVKTSYTLQDLQLFSPLSLIGFFNPTELDPWLVYPIQLLNVFELLYWIALAWQMQEVLEKPFAESLGFVAKTYGVGLAVWVVVVMFLTVSIS